MILTPVAEDDLARRYGRSLLLFGLRHLTDRAAAEDLAQQVLLTTLERLRAGEVRDPEQLGSFVLGMARRMAIELRRGERRRTAILARHGAEFPDRVGPPEAPDRDRLSGCLEGLAPRSRAVVVLSFYAERSAEEIAAELTLAPGNVRVIRHRALAQLRDCLESRP